MFELNPTSDVGIEVYIENYLSFTQIIYLKYLPSDMGDG